jgi:Kef-type K+ transport system membrane component KefB
MSWFFLALGLLLLAARTLGELCRRYGQPAVIGEVMAGVLLGPTVLGRLAPGLAARLFPATGVAEAMLSGIVELGLVLFLFVAGLEVDLTLVRRHRRRVAAVASAGFLVPLLIGVVAVLALPGLLASQEVPGLWLSSLVFGVALSITALPVVARTLKDLGLAGTELGTVIVASALLTDVSGLIIFTTLLAVPGPADVRAASSLVSLVAQVLLFGAILLVMGRTLFDRGFSWVLAHTRQSGGALAFPVTLALLAAAASECLGMHAVFGAFLAGVAAGAVPRLRAHSQQGLGRVVDAVFAPIFFSSIGLGTDFLGHLDPLLLLLVVALACAGKVGGCTAAGWWSGATPREAWVIGLGMNARGAMEIILGTLARDRGLISESLFVSLVGMSLATTMMAGPMIRLVLKK